MSQTVVSGDEFFTVLKQGKPTAIRYDMANKTILTLQMKDGTEKKVRIPAYMRDLLLWFYDTDTV